MADSTAEKLKPRQETALAALVTHPTIRDAAQASGIPERTLFRYLQDADFQEAYRAARRETVNHAVARLQQLCSRATETLDLVMRCPFSPVPSKVAAAKIVLEMSMKAVEIEDLEVRISALEEMK
jgi:hypothetical protein